MGSEVGNAATTMNKLSLALLLVAVLAAVHSERTPQIIQFNDYSLAGLGFSSDSQQLTTQSCFNAHQGHIADLKQVTELTAAQSAESVAQTLGVSVSASGSYDMFSASAEASYFRSIKENDNSISLNYYQYTTSEVTVEYDKEVLNDFGKDKYDGGKNPAFGVVCGDQYITSYEQGAKLVMGLYIQLNSKKDKTEIKSKLKGSFGDIFSVSTKVKSIVENSKISGVVQIHAYQVGGESGAISEIFNKDSEGTYYALSCKIDSMENCLKAAGGLMDYATGHFPKQISAKDSQGMTPLGVAFTNFAPISRLGLNLPKSLVTKEVDDSRTELAKKLKESQYYKEKLFSFLNNGYPVKLEEVFINKVNSIYNRADSNERLLMQPHGGAADCYNIPENCLQIKNKIDSKLQAINKDELSFMNNLKYIVHVNDFVIEKDRDFLVQTAYNTGGETLGSWSLIEDNRSTIQHIEVNATNLLFKHKINYEYDYVVVFNGTVTEKPLVYRGDLDIYWDTKRIKNIAENQVRSAEISLFYFEPYN